MLTCYFVFPWQIFANGIFFFFLTTGDKYNRINFFFFRRRSKIRVALLVDTDLFVVGKRNKSNEQNVYLDTLCN